MDAIKLRRAVSLVASTVLITSLVATAFAAPVAAAPTDEQVAARQARAEARAEAKAAREAARAAARQARAEAKAARKAARQARAEAKAARKAARQADAQKVIVCHKPGTPAEGTLEISPSALLAHQAHDDFEGECGSAAPEPQSTCAEPGTEEVETSADGSVDEGDGVACDEPQQVLVSIDAPIAIFSQEVLELQGDVSGLEADEWVFAWSSTCLSDEELADPAVIASEPDSALLVIREDILTAGTVCDFTLTVTDEATAASGSATVTVAVVAQP